MSGGMDKESSWGSSHFDRSGLGVLFGKLSSGTAGSSTAPPVDNSGALSLTLQAAIWVAAVSKDEVSGSDGAGIRGGSASGTAFDGTARLVGFGCLLGARFAGARLEGFRTRVRF